MSSTSIFESGNFQKISDIFISEGIKTLEHIAKFQAQHTTSETDTVINNIQDSIVALYFGYDLVNIKKHGFDAKNSVTNEFLEVKQCNSSNWGGTWNDTTAEKAYIFQNPKVFIAIAVWENASKLKFIVYGQNPKIGLFLLDKVQNTIVKNKKIENVNNTRSTQKLTVLNLIKDYGFIVYTSNNFTVEETIESIIQKHKSLKNILNYDNVKKL
jgi:hypothetical protein